MSRGLTRRYMTVTSITVSQLQYVCVFHEWCPGLGSCNRASGYVFNLQPACHPCSAMPDTVDAKKLSAANPICTCKYFFLFRIMNYMHIPTENRLNPFCRGIVYPMKHTFAGDPCSGCICDFSESGWINTGVSKETLQLLPEGVSVSYFLSKSEWVPVRTSSSISNSLLSVFRYIRSQSDLMWHSR